MNDAFDNAQADKAILAKLTKLSAFAEGDAQGISTYPRTLLRIGGAQKLHIAREYPDEGTLCGVSPGGRGMGLVEYLGERKHPICAACRKLARS